MSEPIPQPSENQLAGWREWLSLPDLDIPRIKAKLDTGARTSALHAIGLEEFEQAGTRWVRFTVHPRQRSERSAVQVESEVLDWRDITSSNGQQQRRPVIVTNISMFGHAWPIELTLSNRTSLGFRMLLGREALRNRIVVDSGRSYMAGRPARRSARHSSQ